MGGNAFNNTLPDALFPRISPELYTQLKTKLATHLRQFYAVVGTPREAPEKVDYGDIDFVVHSPIEDLRLDAVCAALGARAMIPLEGNRMSHFAVPLEGDAGDGSCDACQAYLQVDVRVCGTPEEWRRVMFFNSYGDMGMILGTLARMHGLAFGSSGLKLAQPLPTAPACTFPLSSDMDEILTFMGLSMARWEEGFSSVKDIFAWLATSSLYSPTRLARTGTERMPNRELKNRDQRKMYQGFFDYAAASPQTSATPTTSWTDAAIDHFGKRDLHTVLMYIAERKAHAKSVLSGTLVMQWTGVSGLPVRTIMNETKRRLGGEDVLSIVSGIAVDSLQSDGIDPVHLRLKVWEDSLTGKTVDDIQSMVVQVKEELEVEGRLWQKSKKKGAGM